MYKKKPDRAFESYEIQKMALPFATACIVKSRNPYPQIILNSNQRFFVLYNWRMQLANNSNINSFQDATEYER